MDHRNKNLCPAPADPQARAAALGGFQLFRDLDADSLADLAQGLHHCHWPAGTLIFSRGDAGDQLLAIIAGRIRLSLSSAQGREIVLTTLGPGEVLGEIALVDGHARSADATAIHETTCLALSRARFEAVARRRPEVGLALARHLALHVRRTNFQMESIALYDLQARLVRFLLYALAREAGQGPQRRLALDLSQSEIAAILGASRPKISLAFGALAATGAVRRDGSTLICDVELLEQMADGDVPPP